MSMRFRADEGSGARKIRAGFLVAPEKATSFHLKTI